MAQWGSSPGPGRIDSYSIARNSPSAGGENGRSRDPVALLSVMIPALNEGHDREDPDVQDHHRHQQLDQAKALVRA